MNLFWNVWVEFGSTVIMQPIPASWIENVECFEPNFRAEMFAAEKCLLMGYDIINPNRTVQKILIDEVILRGESADSFANGMEYAMVALIACQSKVQDARKTWQELDIAKTCSEFSTKIEVSDVPGFLDHIEREGKIYLLASGYNFVEMFSLYVRQFREEAGVSISVSM